MQSVSKKLVQAIELQQLGKTDEAAKLFWKVLKIDPGNSAALYSLSLIALNSGDHAEALRISNRGIELAPLFAQLRLVHGATLQAMGRKEEALQSYDKALELNPNYVEVLVNSGVLLRDMLRHHEALERFNRILSFEPTNTSALANCGIMLTEFKQSESAIAMFEHLISINPAYDYALGLLAYERLHICDWKESDILAKQIIEGIRSGKRSSKSLAFMSISDSAEDHLRAAKIFAQHFCPKRAISYWQGERYNHNKIRLAYVSPDLREHPVGHLMAGVIEKHDKSNFELYAFSLGIDDQSRIRARMLKAFDHFVDVRLMGGNQIAQMMRDMEIDIAVDLGGYTSDTRTDIFAHRPAPVQVNYLGYPGSMGTDYMDYIIADRYVIPDEHRQFYSEQVACLPDTYLPTDASVKISDRTPSRAECGLPEQGIVFCSFSHDYKISPSIFEIWMRVLSQVPGSVLWLMSRGETAQRNLRHEAELRGVDSSRLVFAGRVPMVEDHLARYRQADLFLDTHPYNAHTTAADALMAGLPVVTYMGGAFPARVAASLLHAIGLPELITHSLREYEDMLLGLATAPSRLAALKEKLRGNISTNSLFNTELFCRNLESAYMEMVDRSRQGLMPEHFLVAKPHVAGTQPDSVADFPGLLLGVDKINQHSIGNQLCLCGSGLIFENCHGDLAWSRLLGYSIRNVPKDKLMLVRALDYAKKGNLSMADLFVQSHLGEHKADAEALVLLGEIALKLNVLGVAQRCFEKALLAKEQAGYPYDEIVSTKSALTLINHYLTARTADVGQKSDKYLLIKAWGYGFWSDVDHVIGQLMIAELSNRIPVVHWGKNSLFGDGANSNAFELYFEPVSKVTITDLVSANFSFFPPKWNSGNLNLEDNSKWFGRFGRQNGLLFLGRDEDVVVSDFHTQVVQLMSWVSEQSVFATKNWHEIYAYLFTKYLKLKPHLEETVHDYYLKNMAGRQWLAVHVRGSDKIREQGDLSTLNEEYHALIRSRIEQDNGLGIFLLTDSDLYLQDFKEKYGNRVLFTHSKRTEGDQGVHYMGHSGKEVGESVILDSYLATLCDFFIGNGGSNVSAAIGSLKPWAEGRFQLLGRDLRSNISYTVLNW